MFVGVGEIGEMVANSGVPAKIVLGVLLFFSILSWTIIFEKWVSLRRARTQTRRFMRAFRKAQRLADLHHVSDSFRASPLAGIFESGYEELTHQLGGGGSRNVENVSRALRARTMDETARLESRLSWLATTAGASPFIGLFGTVWGIIEAFQGLGTEGAATLRAVAPGISEALITTAAGLFAAIPALIAYNIFVHQIREFGISADEFSLEFTNRAENATLASQQPAGTVF
jgi:biopolymer transport protein TolQ